LRDCSYGDLSTSPEARIVKKEFPSIAWLCIFCDIGTQYMLKRRSHGQRSGFGSAKKISRTTKLHDWTDNELTLSIVKQILKSGQRLVMAP
jgi:hypothetical protein